MIPAVVYAALHGAAPVAAIVSTRIYRDFAGDSPVAPYIVWSLLAGTPDNHLTGAPLSDRYSVSIDVFALTEQQSDNLVTAARDAMETIGQLTGAIQSLGREIGTKLWRYTFTVDIFRNR